MSFYKKPNITRLDNGMFSCKYENSDGSFTNLIAASHEELVEKLSVAHQSAVAALQRSRRQFETLKSRTYDQTLKEADRARIEAQQDAAVWAFMRGCPEFNPCAANSDILLSWVHSNGLDLTPENLQTAFDLNQDRLVPRADMRPQTVAQPVPTPAAPAPTVEENLPTRADIIASSADEIRQLIKIHSREKIDAILAGGSR